MASALVSNLSKLTISQVPLLQKTCSQIHTQCCPLLFRATQQLWGEPMKKKKRLDPTMTAARMAKRMKKIDKEIKKLSRFGRILKPVEEIEMDSRKLALARERKRNNPALTFDESESRALLHKEWASYRSRKWCQECLVYKRVFDAQEEALQELRAESEDLYQEALKIDYYFLPVEFEGPKWTPPIKDYMAPDGEYVDTTRKY